MADSDIQRYSDDLERPLLGANRFEMVTGHSDLNLFNTAVG